jgi:hypothetical protein
MSEVTEHFGDVWLGRVVLAADKPLGSIIAGFFASGRFRAV